MGDKGIRGRGKDSRLLKMKTITNLLTALIVAILIGSIAVFSIQNIQSISLKFLIFESINFPVGVMLSLAVGFGFILGALLPLFWQKPNRYR